MSTARPRPTRRLSDVALRSALELEKAKVGRPYDKAIIQELASALRRKARPDRAGAPYHFIEPGYLQPFERLYRTTAHHNPICSKALQDFIARKTDKLREAAVATPDRKSARELIDFCIQLHRELTRERFSGDFLALDETASRRPQAPSGFGSAENLRIS